LEEQQVHPAQLFLKTGLFGAEPWSETMRKQLADRLHIRAFDNYGLTEIIGPGVAGECEKQHGLHVNEDQFIVEVVQPATGEPVKTGETGELVFTTITKEGFPVIRYRTGDISALIDEPCDCGRTLRRIRRVSGRTDDLIFYKEHKIFPSQIEEILLQTEEITPHYQIILDRAGSEDSMEIQVEISERIPSLDELKTLERLRQTIFKQIDSALGVKAKITLKEPKSLQQTTEGKVRRVIDKRIN
jgi:phenylacetate-CoA ligase